MPRRARPLPRFAGLLHLVERGVGGRSRDARRRGRGRGEAAGPRLREARDGQGPPRGARLDPAHADLDDGPDDPRPERRDDPHERDQRGAVHGIARRALALSLRLERDAADRSGSRRLRRVRGRRRDPLPAGARLHHRQRAQPEPLLAAAVRARRQRRCCTRVPPAPGDDLRRAEGGPPPLDALRRRACTTRRRQAGHGPRHPLADRVHRRSRRGLPRERSPGAGDGRIRVPPLPGDVRNRPRAGAPSRHLDRARRLPEARLAARHGVRRHGAARPGAADPLRRVRDRDPDPAGQGGPLLRHRACDHEAGRRGDPGGDATRRRCR